MAEIVAQPTKISLIGIDCELSLSAPRGAKFSAFKSRAVATRVMSVRVVARIRPLLKAELEKDAIVTAITTNIESPGLPTVVRIPNPKNENEDFSFHFNSVYDQGSTQQDLFENEGMHHQLKPT